MNPDNTQTTKLVQDLHRLLEKQVESVKKGDFRTVETLSQETSILAAEISKIRPSKYPQLKDSAKKIMRLYKQLELMITAEKETVYQQLQKLGKGIKTVQAYHGQ